MVGNEGLGARVLIIDDDAPMADLLVETLRRRGFDAISRTTAAAGLEAVNAEPVDAVVTDLRLGGASGLDLCRHVVESRPDVPVVVITAFGSLDTAIAAIRVGAYDFITKPLEIETLVLALRRALDHRALREDVRRLRQAVAAAGRFEELIGQSPPMRKLFDLVDRLADSNATVLITGESGTGKEGIARSLHQRGRRRDAALVAINCAAMPESLLESELFGHVRGAFTDARAPRAGLFARANGGTLFLDEIGDMPLGLQPKLLRALQERKVRPIGSDEEQPFDVRVVAATNRDLDQAVKEGRFREDLLYRINVVQVELPPLRARGNDILILAQHFLEQAAARNGSRVQGISSPAARKLLEYSWPGNVRELQNCMERAVALTEFDRITVDDLPAKVQSHRSQRIVVVSEDPEDLVPLEEVERRYILKVLEAVGRNKTVAAQVLGLDRKTLYRKLERWGMSDSSDQA